MKKQPLRIGFHIPAADASEIREGGWRVSAARAPFLVRMGGDPGAGALHRREAAVAD